MAKVRHPLFSGDVSGAFGKKMIFKKGGIVTRMFWPRNPRTAAQQAQREAFKEFSMPGLTQEQADLLYSAILHLHDDHYATLVHGHDHGDLSGLGDDDHAQYFNQVRGDARYLQSVPQQDHGGLAGLGDDDHAQYFNQTRGDARYLQDAPIDGKTRGRKNGAWVETPVSPWTLLSSTNDFGVSYQTVLQNVTWATFTLSALKTYWVRGRIIYFTAAAADFKYKIDAVLVNQVDTRRTHILPGTTAIVSGVDLNTQPTVTLLGSVDGKGFIDFESRISVGNVDRTLNFQIAQNVSSANPTWIYSGSYIEYFYV